jgi:plasmid maintenance system antidote protein VapI
MAKLFISDQRMLDVMDYCIANNISGITTQKEWCIMVGIEPSNINNVRKGLRGFTTEQLLSAGKQFGISMEYLFGFTNQMLRTEKKATAIQLLKQAVRAVEAEMQNGKMSNKTSNKNLK